MKSWFLAGGVVLSLVMGTTTAGAVAPAPSVRSVETLHIPFAPPTGEDIVYDLITTKWAAGKDTENRESVGETRQVLRFEPAETGYVLKLTYVRIAKGAAVIEPGSKGGMAGVPTELQPFVLPMFFDVADDGSLIRIRNWSELRQAISAVPDHLAAEEKDPAKRGMAKEIGKRIVAAYLDLSAEHAPAMLVKVWSSLLGYGDTALEAGEEYEAIEEVQGLFQIKMPLTSRFSLMRDVLEGGLRYRRINEFDQKAGAEAISRHFSQIGEGLTGDKSANIKKALEMVKDMKIEDQLDIVFDAETGLVETAIIERKVAGQAGAAGERTVVKRVR